MIAGIITNMTNTFTDDQLNKPKPGTNFLSAAQ